MVLSCTNLCEDINKNRPERVFLYIFLSVVKLILLLTYQGIGEQIVKKLYVVVVCTVLAQGIFFSVNFVILVVFQNYRLDFIRK